MEESRVKNSSGRILVKIMYNGQEAKSYGLYTDMDVPLSKLFRDFYNRLDKVQGSITFTYKGDRIKEKKTPRELGMKDGSIIDAFEEQSGGG